MPESPVSVEEPRLRSPRVCGRALVLLAALLLALGAVIGWQTSSGLANIERMMAERSTVLHRVVATETMNVARFGSSRRERLDSVLRELVGGSGVVEGVRLEQLGGALRIEHGRLPGGSLPDAAALSIVRVGATLLVGGRLRIETSGCHDDATGTESSTEAPSCGPPSAAEALAAPCGCAPASAAAASPLSAVALGDGCVADGGPRAGPCTPGCPAAGDRSIDGDYRLALALGVEPYLALRRSVCWQGIGGGLLLAALALALWLFARQLHRAANMRQALALMDARARHLESLSVVTGGLAHEIKNPVGALRGFAQLIAERVPAGSSEAEYAELILGELDGITRRIDGLRHFTRPCAPELRPGRPSDVVRRVATLLAPDIAAHELELVLRLPKPAEPETLLDEQRLRDLVVNLLMNAIEASPRAGRIELELSFEPAGPSSSQEGQYTLRVTDEGPGIPAAERAECLRPFYSTKPGGLGLGLALAQRAVEDHGGRLEIALAGRAGARVEACWPRRAPHAEQDRPHR